MREQRDGKGSCRFETRLGEVMYSGAERSMVLSASAAQ